ncbi:cytochrome P450 2U1-like [Glandiceps talaboti]
MLTAIQALLVIVITFAIYFYNRGPGRNLPPGPIGVPVVGCLPWLNPVPCETFMIWSKKYGDVFSVRLGAELVVVVNGYETIKEALVKYWYQFSGRPLNWIWVPLFDNKGLSTSDWSVWKKQRILTLNILRQFGMGRHSMEERISTECEALVAAVKSTNGKPFDPTDFFHHATSNVLIAIMFGQRMEYDDPEFKELLDHTLALVRTGILAGLVSFFPVLFNFPIPPLMALKKSTTSLKQYMERQISNCKEHMNGNQPDCFIEYYIKKVNSSSSSEEEAADVSQLPYVLTELMLGGSDTTATTLKWCVLNLLHNPKTQLRIHKEIESCFSNDQPITYSARTSMPFTEACILETQRLATLFQIGIPHRAIEDVSFHGYNIPKDTMVFFNYWSAHMEEGFWENPKEFNPDRFLDGSGQVINRKAMLAFGMGARTCIGAQIARVELFLMLTSLVREFEFLTPEGCLPPSTKGVHGITYTPKPFKMVAKKREVSSEFILG